MSDLSTDKFMENKASDIGSPANANPANNTADTPSSSAFDAVAIPDADATSSSDNKQAPEPPRWRFVAEAKKSLGYSSLHAGSYVQGQSSDELGAKYTAPDISLYSYKPAKKEPVVGASMEYDFPANKPFSKDETEVGKLDVEYVPPMNVFESSNYDVGRLTIREEYPEESQLPTGTFGGLPKQGESPTPVDRAPFKKWDIELQVGPKGERESEWYDGKVCDSYTAPGDDPSSKTGGTVGKIGFHGAGENEDIFIGEVPKGKHTREFNGGTSFDDDDDFENDPREGSLFFHRDNSTPGSGSSSSSKNVSDGSTQTDDNEKEKRKRCCLYFLLCLLLLLVIYLGLLLGQSTEENSRAAVAAATGGAVGGAVLIPPVILVNETNNATTVPSLYPSTSLTNKPSVQPSTSPSMECPVGTRAFSIEHDSDVSQQQNQITMPSEMTWKIKDACSGDVIAQCPPCSLGTVTLPRPPRPNGLVKLTRKRPHIGHHERLLLQEEVTTTTECLPINNEYVLEVVDVEDSSESCCGFDPSTSIISYDDVIIKYEASGNSLFSSDVSNNNMYFGDRETPCTSDTPSVSPTIEGSTTPSQAPSQTPSYLPSTSPSSSPTLEPTTSSPTKSPVVFLGGCPETFVALSNYNIGTQVESNGNIYECTSKSCGSYGFEPGLDTSSLWRQVWEIVGSCDGTREPTSYPSVPPTASPTKSPSGSPTISPSKTPSISPSKMPTISPSETPTINPSKEPTLRPSDAPTSSPSPAPTPRQRTKQPTNRPTPQPTCSTETDFNLCLAVDMSGSVCNDDTSSECTDCRAQFLPMFFTSECRDNFVSEDTCCNNFDRVKEFSSLIVKVLGDFPAEKSFSVVQFATNAQLVSGLNSEQQTVSVIEQLDYTGGLTNHAAAIQACQRTLPSSGFRKNFIMLITDGVPTQPDYDPEGYAEAQASSAKFDGTFVIPVFISPNNDWSALSFMMRLSSDGKVFDVTDFDSLNSLQDRLVDQVSCS